MTASLVTFRAWGRRTAVALLFTCVLTSAFGCAYVLEGRVIQGGHGAVVVTEPDNPNFEQRGLGDVTIELTLDPGSISPRSLGTQLTDGEGRFRFPIDAAGAGVLEYELGVLCRSKGYQTLYQTLPMPPKSRRLLIVMAPGSVPPSEAEDVIGETLRLGGQRDPR